MNAFEIYRLLEIVVGAFKDYEDAKERGTSQLARNGAILEDAWARLTARINAERRDVPRELVAEAVNDCDCQYDSVRAVRRWLKANKAA